MKAKDSPILTARYKVWSYQHPSGHSKSSGFLRGTSVPVTKWAYALVDDSVAPMLVYNVSQSVSNFLTAEAAAQAAYKADWERCSGE